MNTGNTVGQHSHNSHHLNTKRPKHKKIKKPVPVSDSTSAEQPVTDDKVSEKESITQGPPFHKRSPSAPVSPLRDIKFTDVALKDGKSQLPRMGKRTETKRRKRSSMSGSERTFISKPFNVESTWDVLGKGMPPLPDTKDQSS
jgi:hypothetical protein